MIIMQRAIGGLTLRRDSDHPNTAIYVKAEELAALLADLLSYATDADDATSWDCYAALCGNEQVA
jgi:hypothetical protein